MGGTLDGEIYEYLTDKQKREIEELTQQDLVPLTQREAELAKLLDKNDRSALFVSKDANDKINLEEDIKWFLKKRGIEIP